MPQVPDGNPLLAEILVHVSPLSVDFAYCTTQPPDSRIRRPSDSQVLAYIIRGLLGSRHRSTAPTVSLTNNTFFFFRFFHHRVVLKTPRSGWSKYISYGSYVSNIRVRRMNANASGKSGLSNPSDFQVLPASSDFHTISIGGITSSYCFFSTTYIDYIRIR